MSSPSASTRPSARSKAKGRPRPARGPVPKASRVPWLIAGVVVVVGLAAALALIGGGGGGGSSTGIETAPVTVGGAALAATDGSGLIDPKTDPAVGKSVPSLSGSTPSGTPISFAATAKPTVYLFVAHWCPHCQAEVPRVVTWIAEGRFASSGAVWRTVSTAVDNTRDNYPPSAWLAKVRWDQPVMVDSVKSEAATALGLRSFPYFVFVDGNGVVRQRATGELTLDELTTGIKAASG